LNDRLNPAELEVVEVDALVVLVAEDTLVMIGLGIPVAVKLTDDDNEVDALIGPAEPVVRIADPYDTMVTTLTDAEEDPPDIDEPGAVDPYGVDENPVEPVLLRVAANVEEVTDWAVADP
jgi:hypothetical protein